MSALKALSAGLTIIFHREGIPAALKGGTALALLYGLTRPSTDIDWEGDARTTGEPARLAADARTHREMGGAGLGGALA